MHIARYSMSSMCALWRVVTGILADGLAGWQIGRLAGWQIGRYKKGEVDFQFFVFFRLANCQSQNSPVFVFVVFVFVLLDNEKHPVHQLEQLLVDDVVLEKVLLHVRDVREPRERSLANLELLELFKAHLAFRLVRKANDVKSPLHHLLHAGQRGLGENLLHALHLARRDRHFDEGGLRAGWSRARLTGLAGRLAG